MDLTVMTHSLQQTLGAHVPAILGALGILIVGWIVAVVIRAGVSRLLRALRVNAQIEESAGQHMNVEGSIAAGAFWLVLLLSVVGVFNVLNLEMLSNPFSQMIAQILGYLPHLVAGVALTLLAWLAATVLRAITTRLLSATRMDEKLLETAGMQPVSGNLGNVVFWLVVLLFLPAVLAAFQLHGLLEPVQVMMNTVLATLPNVFAAAVIGFVGWLVAKVLRGLVANLLAAAGVDRMTETIGLSKSFNLPRLAGTLVFILVFVPTLIAALQALQIEAISGPATQMLEQLFAAIPAVVSAALILVLTYFVARFVATVITRLLEGLGVDQLPARLGMQSSPAEALKPSVLVGWLAFFFAMLFASVEAANRLGFTQVRDVVTTFIKFSGDVLLGGVILVIGWWLAGLAHAAIARVSAARSLGLAQIARVAILGLVTAMGLRAMGIADDIVNLAFGLTVGAVAVAVALSFGLGGRDAAGKQMEYWLSRWRQSGEGGGGMTTAPQAKHDEGS